jgi:hypothetical protein
LSLGVFLGWRLGGPQQEKALGCGKKDFLVRSHRRAAKDIGLKGIHLAQIQGGEGQGGKDGVCSSLAGCGPDKSEAGQAAVLGRGGFRLGFSGRRVGNTQGHLGSLGSKDDAIELVVLHGGADGGFTGPQQGQGFGRDGVPGDADFPLGGIIPEANLLQGNDLFRMGRRGKTQPGGDTQEAENPYFIGPATNHI